jgi:hypothetical protein
MTEDDRSKLARSEARTSSPRDEGIPQRGNAPVVAVTVLEDRASVTRRGTFAAAAGQQRVVIERVAPVLADKTLAATATGARVLDVRCERYVAPWREGAPGEPTALHDERTRLHAVHAAAEARARGAAAEVEALAAVETAALHDLAIAATRGQPAVRVAEELAALDARATAARARRVDAELEVEDTAAQLARLAERIARAEAEAGEDAARLVIDLVAEHAGEVTVIASYVVPGAAWRPYHRARLVRAADGARVEWQTTACVWQATGEDWIDAELRCSLERPSLGVEPPELDDDELAVRRKAEMVVEMRDQEVQTAGLGGAPAEVPGIDDGGLGLSLSAGRATVRADGTPHRLPVGGFSAPAQLALVAIPLRAAAVHVRARLVNTGELPLLAGPVDLIRASGYVGRAEIGFVAPGEKVHVGFGPEADVRVHRDETRTRDDAGLLGGWNVQKVRVAVRLSNLGGERREVLVTERIPISEVEQVDVKPSAPDAYLLGEDDQPGGEEITQVTARALDERGLVTWSVELPSLGRRAVTLEYVVKSQRGVAGV